MLEIILLVVISIGIGKVASSDGQSGIVWGALTGVLCLGSIYLVPLPFLRLLAAGVAGFLLYIGYKVAFQK